MGNIERLRIDRCDRDMRAADGDREGRQSRECPIEEAAAIAEPIAASVKSDDRRDHDFAQHHELSFPEDANPGLFVGLGPLALTYLLEAGGSGYFRQRAVAPHIAAGKLHLVALALQGLRNIAASAQVERRCA